MLTFSFSYRGNMCDFMYCEYFELSEMEHE